ncbi:enoyl-[acyl-carrier-protein] reductase, mitochondrial [Aplysia californica]|uniref:Enoyl-[acyl-carrier-protein] reductase, mitochondrial n=1 Tax=Aplysia californica TaxID=6500 RepID=A0ABM0JXS4_APLCA|nr:enoyl-[acyl-carrier-protein] reductase, mitochondrial [Aplysia californica]
MAASIGKHPCRLLWRTILSNGIRKTLVQRGLSSCQLFIEECGDPNEVLKNASIEIASPLASREVLVKMMMSPINPSDINMIEGTYFVQPPLPAVMGNEGVGKIAGVGKDVRGLSEGDWIIPADTAWGTWRNYKVALEEDVIKIPNDIPLLSAATLSVNPCTAYRMLKDYVDLKSGDVVIQNGANSGVGINVIQLAKEWNFKTVNIVRDRPDFERLKKYLMSLGADYVVTEEFVRKPEMKKLMKDLGSKPKLAFNGVGGNSATELIRYLGQGGVMVTYGGMSRRPVMAPTGALIFKEIKLCGYWNTQWNHRHADDLLRFEMLADLCSLIKKGKLSPPPCEFYALEEYKGAIRQATEGFKGGKMVFQME